MMTVEIPCKIGDKVLAIRSYSGHKRAVEGIVSEMYFLGEDMELVVVVKNVARGIFGERIFHTKEEAEEAIKMTNDEMKSAPAF